MGRRKASRRGLPWLGVTGAFVVVLIQFAYVPARRRASRTCGRMDDGTAPAVVAGTDNSGYVWRTDAGISG